MPPPLALRLLELRLTPPGEVPIRVPLEPLDALRPGLPLPALLRAALDGPTGDGDAVALSLEMEVGSHRFRVERGAVARLVRIDGDVEEIVAEGDAEVTELVARLAGTSEPLGRRLVARVGVVSGWLSDELARGATGSVHARVTAELEAAAAALGGRMRDLLQRAHGLLQDATEELAPHRDAPLAPEDLGLRRDEIVLVLGRASGRVERLDASVATAESLARRIHERHARMQEYLRAEQIERKLDRQRHLMESQRRRLDRAQAAARLGRRSGSPGSNDDPERSARVAAEREAEEARAELSRARHAHAVEEARDAERRAVADWIARLEGMHASLARRETTRTRLREMDARARELEQAERDAGETLAHAQHAAERASLALAALDASPEEASFAHAEAARAARLAADVRRLTDVRDDLRVKAREVQFARIAVERAEEELALAQREVEWNRTSTQPKPASELPSLPGLVARLEELAVAVDEAAASLSATREELRQRTAALGTQAYLSPELLEAEAREKAEIASRFGESGADRAGLEQELASLHARAAQAAAARERASEDLGTLALAQLEDREIVERLEDGLPAALREPRAIDAALETARAEHETRRAASDAARDALKRAETRARAAEETLRDAREAEASASRRMIDLGSEMAPLRAAGFSSWDEVEEARLPLDEVRALEADIAEHEALEKIVAEGQRIGSEDVLLPRAEPAQAELMHALLLHAREVGHARRDRLVRELAAIDRWLDALDEIAAELELVEDAAGLRDAAESPASTFERRVHDALTRKVLARTEGRLARWQRPWCLSWVEAGEGGGSLVVRDAETDALVAAADAVDAPWLALALAVELALAGEPVAPDPLVAEGLRVLPAGLPDVRIIVG